LSCTSRRPTSNFCGTTKIPSRLFKEQRRYIRVETDANSTYHTPEKPQSSRVNIIATIDGVKVAGSTPLKGGRMRIILGAALEPPVGAEGNLRVELSRPGLPTLGDERGHEDHRGAQGRALPASSPCHRSKCCVSTGRCEHWAALGCADDVNDVASSPEMERNARYLVLDGLPGVCEAGQPLRAAGLSDREVVHRAV